MNRIDERFAQLKARQEKGFIVYIGGGDPDIKTTIKLAIALDRAGVDLLEIGVPFSDPLADGLVNQLAAQRGLASGATPQLILDAVAAIREQSPMPIVLYIYYNLVYRHGLPQFVQNAARAGVDGLLILDLPPEESANYESLMRQAGLCWIYLVAPTTPEDRMQLIGRRGSGFIYYVSREGVTGMQNAVSTSLPEMAARLRSMTSLPIAVGFGISTPEQARQVAQHCDAVVVGSAIVDQIARYGQSPELLDRVASFASALSQAVKSKSPMQ